MLPIVYQINEEDGKNMNTLLTLLRILFLGRIGSIRYVLPIRQNIDILNRDIRAHWASYVVRGITHLKVRFVLDFAKSQIAEKN